MAAHSGLGGALFEFPQLTAQVGITRFHRDRFPIHGDRIGDIAAELGHMGQVSQGMGAIGGQLKGQPGFLGGIGPITAPGEDVAQEDMIEIH